MKKAWQHLAKSYPPQLEALALLLLALTVYVVASSYAALPDQIPTHFDASGRPDDFGGKSQILVWPIMAGVVYVVITGISVLLALARDPRKFINLPPSWKARLTEERGRELASILNRMLFGMKVLILGMMAYSAYMTVQVAHGRAEGLGGFFYVPILGVLLLVALMLWRSYKLTRPRPGARVP